MHQWDGCNRSKGTWKLCGVCCPNDSLIAQVKERTLTSFLCHLLCLPSSYSQHISSYPISPSLKRPILSYPILSHLSPSHSTTFLGLPPTDAVLVLCPLENARRRLLLRTGLHLVFLVTPPNTNIEPDWCKYENIVTSLYKENKVGSVVCPICNSLDLLLNLLLRLLIKSVADEV